jgi:phage-related protein
MRGEFDPMEQFGVSIKKADINARLAAQGQNKLKGEAKTAAEAAALSALIWEKTSDAQGQAAREADTAAAANARATAAMTDAGASIATSFLPAAAAAAGKLATLAGWLSEHPKLVYGVVGALVALRVIIALNSAAMAIYMQRAVFMAAATKAATAAQWLLNVALNANPIGLIVAAVALLIAGIVLLWKKNEGFRDFMKTAWSAITSAVKTSIDAVTGPLQRFIDKLQAIWDKVQKVKNSAGGLLGGLNPFRGADSGGFAAAGSFTTGGGFTRGGVTVGQLVYNGSGDVAADGRTLRALLESGDITQGRHAGAPRRVAW